MSLPLPGAWIEISLYWKTNTSGYCRSLYRERGLKSKELVKYTNRNRRSLYRERGLKSTGTENEYIIT